MGLKERLLSLAPGHKDAKTESDAAEPQDAFGLHLLYDGTKDAAESSLARDGNENPVCLEPVDIIAVHGLGGGAFSTWRHPKSGIMWLQDLLPYTMHMSRIMSYGYDAKIYKNRSTLHMMDNAENLLFEIQAVRNSKTLQTRRIIFIGHGFGGLVIKKALIMAREEEKYQNVLRSTNGIMFMGTPHNGADAAKLASTIANIANSITTLNTKNLKTLERDSVTLQEISRSFGFLTHFKIVTVIESDKTPIPYTNAYTLIVPRPSARLNLGDRETVLSILGADYHMICKFRGEDDKQYCKIKSALVTLATTSSASISTLQHIPCSPDAGFAGRTAILKDLHSAFSIRGKHTRVALYGLGGIG
ncbi:hypothetical protein N7G274_001348, partial [Stereocaulon virgatum]